MLLNIIVSKKFQTTTEFKGREAFRSLIMEYDLTQALRTGLLLVTTRVIT